MNRIKVFALFAIIAILFATIIFPEVSYRAKQKIKKESPYYWKFENVTLKKYSAGDTVFFRGDTLRYDSDDTLGVYDVPNGAAYMEVLLGDDNVFIASRYDAPVSQRIRIPDGMKVPVWHLDRVFLSYKGMNALGNVDSTKATVMPIIWYMYTP